LGGYSRKRALLGGGFLVYCLLVLWDVYSLVCILYYAMIFLYVYIAAGIFLAGMIFEDKRSWPHSVAMLVVGPPILIFEWVSPCTDRFVQWLNKRTLLVFYFKFYFSKTYSITEREIGRVREHVAQNEAAGKKRLVKAGKMVIKRYESKL
jgi:hypothetical protein